MLFQWPLILVHELGHGFFARAFGYGPVRLLIGSGKTLFHFSFLGFTWLINLIPFGGLTYAVPKAHVLRWQWILFVSGGLIANAVLLAVAWILFRPDSPILPRNVLQALIFANALVIVENILPYTAQTLFGPLDTDGKLLYHALFYWNKPLPQSGPPGKAHRLTFTILKILTVIFLSFCAILLLFIGGFILYDLPGSIVVRISFGSFLLALGMILSWYSWRLLKEPLGSRRHHSVAISASSVWRELQSTSTADPDDLAFIQTHLQAKDYQSAHSILGQLLDEHPNDRWILWIHAEVLLELNEPVSAEAAYDRLLTQLAAADPSLQNESEIYLTASTKRLHAVMLQNDGRFENECTAFLKNIISAQQKVTLLDQLACTPLINDRPHLFHSSEFCIRKALAIAPNSLTLQGTLGALLAERREFTEAEPLLRACHQSPALHDRGITSYYLALFAEHNGDFPTARKLAKQSIALYPEPWLTKKATALLSRINSAVRETSRKA